MSDIQFEDQPNEFGVPKEESAGSDITGTIVAWGLAGNREQAQYVLIGVIVLALVAAFFLYKMIGGGGSAPPLLPE